MKATARGTPLWNKSIARHLASPSPGVRADEVAPAKGRASGKVLAPAEPRSQAIDPRILERLGLAPPPADPRLLAEYLLVEDAADSAVDADAFGRGIRRAVRLGLAFSARLHRRAGKTWTLWVREHFQAGYECYRRYHRAAELQMGLISRGLPLLANENQARALALFQGHESFWEALSAGAFKGGFPAAAELKETLRSALGLPSLASATPRIKLHRTLLRIVASVPADDSSVAEAVGYLRRAIATLERGGEAP